MVPTPRALDLAALVRPALEQLRAALEFGSAASSTGQLSGTVVLGMDDYLQAFLLPELASRIERRAPGIRLDVRSSGARRRAVPLLREGHLDLAVDVNDTGEHRDFESAPLFTDRYVCLVRKGVAGTAPSLSRELFSVLNHVVEASVDPERNAIEREILGADLTRRVSVRLPGVLSAPWLVAVSDATALVPARLAAWFSEILPIDVLEPPVPLPPLQVAVHWHRRTEQSPIVMHVRNELVEIAGGL